MVDCWLPYGDTEVYVSVELESLLGTLGLKPVESNKPATEHIVEALMEPYGKTLEELIEPGHDIAIAVDTYLNPQAVVQALTELTRLLVELVIPKERITLFLGNGEASQPETRIRKALLETPALKDIKIIDHNRGTKDLISLGTTHQGTPIEVNKRFHEASIRIALGETRIDPLTGYSGAHSAVVPGLVSAETIKGYRRKYLDAKVSPGQIEFNPLKEEVLEMVATIGLDFALNLVTDIDGKITSAHGGGIEESWGQAINSLADQPEASFDGKADILILGAGGTPYDNSLYRATWSLLNASKVVKRNGVIVLLAQCASGLGGEAYTQLARVSESSEIKRRYMYGAEALDLLKKVQKNNRVILVSALPDYLVEDLGIEVARTANDAYKLAAQSRRDRKTLVIPNGSKTMVV